MKLFSKLAVASAVIALAFVSTASAQSMRIAVPFGFNAGSVALPAGTYSVGLNQAAQFVTLHQLDGKANCVLMVKSFAGNGVVDRGSLVFTQYGTAHYLSRVKTAGVNGAAELYKSRSEREIAKAQPGVKPAVVLASSR
jgi:hypothetical protein